MYHPGYSAISNTNLHSLYPVHDVVFDEQISFIKINMSHIPEVRGFHLFSFIHPLLNLFVHIYKIIYVYNIGYVTAEKKGDEI